MKQFFLILFFVATFPAQAAITLQGHVVGVKDGDTLVLLDAGRTPHTIRLAEIDAPESSQAFGKASKQSLSAMAYDRDATAHCKEKDRYGRQVCRIVVDGKDVNRAQVATGMAWVYRQYSKDPLLIAAEMKARYQRAGLWADADPVPPWNYRRSR